MALRPSQIATGESRPRFAELNNLASEKLGARILFATDDWFAVAENLLKDSEAEWREGEFTKCGKWMDGWETRRKRKPGHDWCIIKLGVAGEVAGVDVDTSFFTGNYVPRVSLQAATLTKEEENLIPKRKSEMGSEALEKDLVAVARLGSEKWQTIIPITEARPGYRDTCHTFLPSLCASTRYTHLRLNVYPDGGIARLRVFGRALADVSQVSPSKVMDLVSLRNGGVCLAYSDAHYGHPRNLISPWAPVNMADGWETARRLDRPSILKEGADGVLQVAGWEWALFKLGLPGTVKGLEVDTYFFKGNFPDSCRVDGCFVSDEEVPDPALDGAPWLPILPSQKLKPNAHHDFSKKVRDIGVVSHVRLVMAPDGGISRLKVLGTANPSVCSASSSPSSVLISKL
ncbi:allantoicase-like [Scylla paramamosain]|uniref:allantoicase-like n=1 Tax=Scylla paramamosain TaxID=85552 RepID=UPI003082AD3D